MSEIIVQLSIEFTIFYLHQIVISLTDQSLNIYDYGKVSKLHMKAVLE
jgi:hypothetical protein